jgi:glycosyltransferase involved in cell wall biosynthesis
MRIAFYAPMKPPDHPAPSGDRAMARLLMAALESAGHQVRLGSRFRSYESGDPRRQARFRDIGGRLAKSHARWAEVHGAAPDLWFTYHLYHKAPDWLGPAVAERLGIPYVLAEASYAPKQAGGRWDIGHRGAADAISRAARIFQPNPADIACLLPLVGGPERIVPLPPFADTARFREPEREASRAAIAEAFNLPLAEPWLIAVAMMRDDQKLQSYRCLAEALARLVDRPWRLVLAGAGPAEHAVRAAFAPLGERARFPGLLDDLTLRQLYRGADVYVWPAIKEAWGMALLEAQAAGLPAVAGGSEGVAGIVANGATGVLAPSGEAAAFADALGSLLADPARRRRMSETALARMRDRHDIGVAAALLDRELRAVIGK